MRLEATTRLTDKIREEEKAILRRKPISSYIKSSLNVLLAFGTGVFVLIPIMPSQKAEARSYSNSRYTYPYRRNTYRYPYSRYRYGYRSTTRPDYSNPYVQGRDTKKFTTWEAPTKEDNLINEEIEKAQVDFGPTSAEAGKVMMKYAKRYYEARDFEKSKKMTDRIIKLNKVSKFDGINMADVTKLRADAIKAAAPPVNPYRAGSGRGIIIGDNQYKNRIQNRAGTLAATRVSAPKTAIAQVKQRYPGLTEIDYSSQAVQRARRSSTNTSAPSSATRVTTSSPPSTSWLKNYRPTRMPSRMPYGFGGKDFSGLDKLGGQFERYQ